MRKLIALSLMFLVLAPVWAQDIPTQEEIEDMLFRSFYSDFVPLESFGSIGVQIRGNDAEKIGLDKDELTDFLRLKYKNNFAMFPYKDLFKDLSDEETGYEFFEKLDDKDFTSKIGEILVKVSVAGTDYPIAYHVELRAGTIEADRAYPYEEAVLGFGSKDDVPDTVKASISELVEHLAITFFKVREEL